MTSTSRPAAERSRATLPPPAPEPITKTSTAMRSASPGSKAVILVTFAVAAFGVGL